MPKINPNSSRKPPEPGATHDEIDQWIAQSMPAIQPMLTKIDRMICDVLPDAQYAVKWGRAYYGLEEQGWVIQLANYHKSANIVFLGGVDLDPQPPLGEAGRSRYVKVYSLDEVRAPEIRTWIEQAARFPGWK